MYMYPPFFKNNLAFKINSLGFSICSRTLLNVINSNFFSTFVFKKSPRIVFNFKFFFINLILFESGSLQTTEYPLCVNS